MNNTNNFIKIIAALEVKLNLSCIVTEIQPRKVDEIDFAHTIFKTKDAHQFAYLLIATLKDETIVLVSDKYSMNEIADKVERKNNKICVTKDGIYQLAI